ncbi:hypothetical protein DTO282F9_3265 [Paecilomyces variotii]|nr:hypothetical protein DTO282F9_3265 [Paecilomyces variotii]
MPDPASLPPELFGMILHEVIRQNRDNHGSPEKRFDPALLPLEIPSKDLDAAVRRLPDARSEERQLSDLCRVGKQWRDLVQPTLYETFTYRRERQSLRNLWLYLRTILSRPELASCVKHLEIRAWGCWVIPSDVEKPENQLTLSQAERVVLKAAIGDAGFNEKDEFNMFWAIEKNADRTPLMAILLTRLPNVESIQAHVPAWCYYLSEIFKKAIEKEEEGTTNRSPRYRAFQKLSRAEFFCEGYHCNDTGHPWERYYDLNLDYLWPVFYLPQLKVLGLYDLNPRGAAAIFDKNARQISPVVDLTIVLDHPLSEENDDLWTLLDLPETLDTLRLSVMKTLETDPVTTLKRKLWPSLDRFKDQLFHLDLHEHVNEFWCPPPIGAFGEEEEEQDDYDDDDDDSYDSYQEEKEKVEKKPVYCCPLRSFLSLKHLAVVPDLLLGDQCKHQKLTTGYLRAHLPNRLTKLTLYRSCFANFLYHDWDTSLEGYVRRHEDEGGPMDKILINERFVDSEGSSMFTPYGSFEKTEKACQEQGIVFQTSTEAEHELENGGRLTKVYTDTENIRGHFEYMTTLHRDPRAYSWSSTEQGYGAMTWSTICI